MLTKLMSMTLDFDEKSTANIEHEMCVSFTAAS